MGFLAFSSVVPCSISRFLRYFSRMGLVRSTLGLSLVVSGVFSSVFALAFSLDDALRVQVEARDVQGTHLERGWKAARAVIVSYVSALCDMVCKSGAETLTHGQLI